MEHFTRSYPEIFTASSSPKIIKPNWYPRSLESLPPQEAIEKLQEGPLLTVTLPLLPVYTKIGNREITFIVSGVRSIEGKPRVTGLGGGVTNHLTGGIPEIKPPRKNLTPEYIRMSLLREISEEGLSPLDLLYPGIRDYLAKYWKTHHAPRIPDTVRFIGWEGRRIIVDALFSPPRKPFNISYSNYVRLRSKTSLECTGRVFLEFWKTQKAFDKLIKGLGLSMEDLLNKPWEEVFPHLIKIAQELYQNGLEIEEKIYRFGFTPSDAIVYVISFLRLFTFSHEKRPPSLPKVIFQGKTAIATADTSLWDYSSGKFQPKKEVILRGYRIPLSNGNGKSYVVISHEFLKVVEEIYSSLEKIQNVLELGKKASEFFKTDPEGFLQKVKGYSHLFPKIDYDENVFLERIRKFLEFIKTIFEKTNGEENAFSHFISRLTSTIVSHLRDLDLEININVLPSSIEEFLMFLKKAKEALKGYLSSKVEADYLFYAILWLITFAPLTETVFAELFRKIIEKPGGLKKLTPYVTVFPPPSPTVRSFYLTPYNKLHWTGVQQLLEKFSAQETKV